MTDEPKHKASTKKKFIIISIILIILVYLILLVVNTFPSGNDYHLMLNENMKVNDVVKVIKP